MNNRPNILLITTDHLRYDCVGANGNPHIHTPNLDKLAGDGVCLDRYYVQNPYCMPSRASIWTGRYPQNHRVTTNGIALRKSEVTIAHALSDAGYMTANVGKLHFQPHFGRDHRLNDEAYSGYGYQYNRVSDEPGCYEDVYMQWVARVAPEYVDAVRVPGPDGARGHFDEWMFKAPTKYTHANWVASQAEEFINGHEASRPFFLSLGFYGPHPPLNPPKEYVDLYDQEKIPLPIQHPADMEKSSLGHITPERWRKMKTYFYAMCSHIDDNVGRILKTLDDKGLAENTIIIFTADHGDVLGDHGQVGKDPTNYEAIIKVPCLISWPKCLPRGRRVGGMVESVDLLPTICNMAGIEVPRGVKGQNISDLLKGETEKGRDDILVDFKDPRAGVSVKTLRTKRYKYFRFHDGREILYDFNDPDEEVFDRSGCEENKAVMEKLRQRLLERLILAEDDLPPRTHEF